LSTCRTSHTDCALEHKMPSYLPKRVIHVGTGTAHPFLYIPNERTIGSWVALSYCWGGASDFTLTQSRLTDFQRGFPLEDFPNTIRDAIIVMRALGHQYLWVDALCILKYDESDLDQTSKLDWVTEAPKMARIYRDAIVTIEATASPAVTLGILHKRVVPVSATLPWKIPQETRGWTLQESLLSSRTLTFTSKQMIWHCRSMWVVESGIDKTFLLYQWWHRIVTVYCQRKLTYVTDKLPAIAGFAKRMHDTLLEQDYYCAGLWRQNLVTELLWYIDIHNRDVRDFSEPPSVYVGPSWSWVNVGGYICFKTLKRDPDRRV
ncbi:HET-domain-containing protein, partial [Lizonia empirigonia]